MTEEPLIRDGELDRIRDAARRGQRSTVSRLCREIEKRAEAAGRPLQLHSPEWALLDECYDIAYCVDMALAGETAKLEGRWLEVSMSRDGSPPQERAWLTDRLDHIWDAVQQACGREMPRPPEEPEWARSDGPVEARLVLRSALKTVLHRPGAEYTFEIHPTMLEMRGALGRVRIPRAPVTEVHWLRWPTRTAKEAPHRFVFYSATGEPVGHWDYDDRAGLSRNQRKLASWLQEQGWPVSRVLGGYMGTTDDPGELLGHHRI